VSRSR
jgi:hypothetical protein